MEQKIHLNTLLDTLMKKIIIRPLLLKLLQMIGYLKEFDDNMTMSLRVDDSKLFKKYCKIWKTIKGLL